MAVDYKAAYSKNAKYPLCWCGYCGHWVADGGKLNLVHKKRIWFQYQDKYRTSSGLVQVIEPN